MNARTTNWDIKRRWSLPKPTGNRQILDKTSHKAWSSFWGRTKVPRPLLIHPRVTPTRTSREQSISMTTTCKISLVVYYQLTIHLIMDNWFR